MRKLFAVCLCAGTMGFASAAQADDYGCQVLLCLANPNGPEAVGECVPPIERLWDDLKNGNPFPSCETSGNSRATPGYSYYDACPAATSALAMGSFAIQGSTTNTSVAPRSASTYIGIGTGEGLTPTATNGGLPAKICVGTLTGSTFVSMSSNGSRNGTDIVQVGIYDRVVLLSPQNTPRYIDVVVENQLYRRVRW